MTNKRIPFLTALIEMSFIMFLFYANLLMGEFTQTKIDGGRKFFPAFLDIFSWTNFFIGFAASIIGYFVFSFLRRRV